VFAFGLRRNRAYLDLAAVRWSLAGLLACLLLAAAAVPAVAAPSSLITSVTGFDDYDPAAFREARAAGATQAELRISWRDVAPPSQPASWQPEDPADSHYDWSYVDKGVTNAIVAGLTPVLQVDGAPLWAQRCKAPPEGAAGDLCDPDPAALAVFAKAAARRYSGNFNGLPRVIFWQALNEPNLSLFFYPQFAANGKPVSPGLYRSLINAFYTAVKSVDPTNLVIAGGLGPIAVPKYTVGPMQFARQLLCMKGREKPRPLKGNCHGVVSFDIFDIHPYTTGAPIHEGGKDDVQLGDLAKLTTLLRAADRAGRINGVYKRTPLWINEFSWDSNPPDPGGLPMKIATRWVAEALFVAWRAGISHFSWYSLRDQHTSPGDSFPATLQSGLYFRGPEIGHDQPKELMYAFRFPFVAYPTAKGVSVWGRTPTNGGGKVTIQLLRKGNWINALTVNAGPRGIFTGTIGGRYGQNRKGAARAIFNGESAMPFAMKPTRDFKQPPFG
jgi:hypothetical protein